MLLNWTLGPTEQGARDLMAVHHALGISRQRNSGYRPSRVNILWHKVSPLPLPFPPLAVIHTSLKREVAQQLHYTHHYASLMALRYTTLVPALMLHIGPACEAGLSAGMQREHVPSHRRKKASHILWLLIVWLIIRYVVYE